MTLSKRRYPVNPDVQQGPTPKGRKASLRTPATTRHKTEKNVSKGLDTPTPDPVPSTASEWVTDMPLAQTPTPSTPVVQEQKTMTTFKFVRVSKFGNALYRRDGGRGTVQINKTMFVGEPPATLSLDAELKAPGTETVKANSPEAIAKMQKQAEAAQARLAKTQERLAKLNAKLAAISEPVTA